MNSVLITGGLGFIGGRLSRKLSENHNVIVSSRKKITPEIVKLYGEIQTIQHDQLLSKDKFPENIDTVIHLAALNELDSVKYPSEAIRVNVDETRMILEASVEKGVKNFIYFSTAHIYGSPLQGTITESTCPVPVHPYAITHKAAEDYVAAASFQKKIKCIVIRLSNAFGAPITSRVNRWTLVANDLCRQAIEKGSLALLSNGCQYRDFVCLTDVENIISEVIKNGVGRLSHNIYNLGAGKSLRVLDLAKLIASSYNQIFGREIRIELPAGSRETIEPPLHFSVDRLHQEGFTPKNDFDNEIQGLLRFCKTNFSNFD
jgi:UDP-glucose 4-epimerase